MNVQYKNILVCGMARSGLSVAVLLAQKGAKVTIQDIKKESEFSKDVLDRLMAQGITLFLGKNPDDIVADFDLVVVSPGVPLGLPFLETARKQYIPIVGEVEVSSWYCAAPIIAITGTNGKTTTTALTGAIVQAAYPNAVIAGNIGIPFSEQAPKVTEKDWVVLEASSFQLESIDQFHPQVAAVLNITPDHLDRHKTMEAYVEAKENVFRNQTASDIAVLNADDPVCRLMHEKTKARIIYFSRKKQLDEGIFLKEAQIHMRLFGKDMPLFPVAELKLLGDHNLENAMAAVAMALAAGIPIPTIQKVLHEFRGVPHRIEYVTTVGGVDFFNDSKGTNPDAAMKSIFAMKKPIVLIAGGYEKNSDFSDWIRCFDGRVKKVVVLGAVKERMIQTMQQQQFYDYIPVETFDEAVHTAYAQAVAGDCVLLSPACASWGMFRDYEERGDCFKALAQSL